MQLLLAMAATLVRCRFMAMPNTVLCKFGMLRTYRDLLCFTYGSASTAVQMSAVQFS